MFVVLQVQLQANCVQQILEQNERYIMEWTSILNGAFFSLLRCTLRLLRRYMLHLRAPRVPHRRGEGTPRPKAQALSGEILQAVCADCGYPARQEGANGNQCPMASVRAAQWCRALCRSGVLTRLGQRGHRVHSSKPRQRPRVGEQRLLKILKPLRFFDNWIGLLDAKDSTNTTSPSRAQHTKHNTGRRTYASPSLRTYRDKVSGPTALTFQRS